MLYLNQILIKDIYNNYSHPPIVISQEDDIAEVIKLFSTSSELRGLFVTDNNGQFIGVITRTDLIDWTRAHVGEFFQEGGQQSDKTIRLGRLFRMKSVGEIMDPDTAKAAVRLDNTAKDAMKILIELDVIVMPVVDDEHKIIGDITLSEILAASLKEEKK